jgi:hypothetical protein
VPTGYVVGFIIGLIGVLAGISRPIVIDTVFILEPVIAAVWYLVVVRMPLRKRYGEFRLALRTEQRFDAGVGTDLAALISVWWLIVWRTIVGGLILIIIAAVILTLIGGGIDLPLSTGRVVARIIGALIATLWLMPVVRMALRKHYGEFRLAVIPHKPAATTAPRARTRALEG